MTKSRLTRDAIIRPGNKSTIFKRGRIRPTLLRDGSRGRPRKQYSLVKIYSDEEVQMNMDEIGNSDIGKALSGLLVEASKPALHH